jgi:hypothetical protein
MRIWNAFVFATACVIFPTLATLADPLEPETAIVQEEPGFVPLFSGESAEGWEGNMDWFRIEQGVVIAGTLEKPIPRNEFLCTKQQYENFELRLEAKLVGKGDNAGIQIRSERVPDHHEVTGYQVDMGTAWNRSVWGGLYDESRRNKMLAEPSLEVSQKAFRPNDWNALRILCEGKRIQIWLNDVQTVDYTESDEKIPLKGLIGLQIHSGPPAEAHYRKLRIKPL